MEPSELIKQAKRIIENGGHGDPSGTLAQAREFLRVYAGERNSFLKTLNEVKLEWSSGYQMKFISSALEGFINYVENGLIDGISFERKAQIDVVSDFLNQANSLLGTKSVHSAAPTVIIGAALEEFLRNWIEELQLSLKGKKPSIDSYAKVLREHELITKQDLKDIISWGGLRNHAAHGEWEEVSDKKRIRLMLEGINLFMRKYVK